MPPAGPLDAKVRESHRLDFKETASPNKTAEHAKDMAAFANGFGGVVLIGSKSDKGIVEHTGISREHAARIAEVYEQTAKDQCSPSPVVKAILITMPGNPHVLLAVNVAPRGRGARRSEIGEEQGRLARGGPARARGGAGDRLPSERSGPAPRVRRHRSAAAHVRPGPGTFHLERGRSTLSRGVQVHHQKHRRGRRGHGPRSLRCSFVAAPRAGIAAHAGPGRAFQDQGAAWRRLKEGIRPPAPRGRAPRLLERQATVRPAKSSSLL